MDRSYAIQIVKNNGNRITMVPPELIDEEIRAIAIARTPTAIEHLAKPSVKEQELAISVQGQIDREGIFDLVSMIDGISAKVLDKTVDINGHCIKLIEKPTDKQLTRAVKRDGDAIKHIPNPAVTLQKIAVAQDHKNIKHIANPDYGVVDTLIGANPYAIEFVAHPHRDHQLKVLNTIPDDGIHYLQEVDDDIALQHITNRPEQIELLVNQTEECCWAALTADGKYISYIRNPTPEMESYAKLVSDGS